jgi:hypothetical protein
MTLTLVEAVFYLEADYNTPTVEKATEREPSAWGYKWATDSEAI